MDRELAKARTIAERAFFVRLRDLLLRNERLGRTSERTTMDKL